MFSLLKSFIKSLLFASFFFLLSCAQTNGNDQSNEKPSDNVIDEEVINENYQAELQRNMSGLRQMDNNNLELKREKEELRKEEEIREVKSWLIGTWEWTGNIWGQRIWSRLDISDNYIINSSSDGVLDQGSYSIDLKDNVIHFGNHSYAKIDAQRRKIYADEREAYRKVSNTPSFSTNGAKDTYYSGSNNSSSYGSNEVNRIAQRLEKLDDEEAEIIRKVDPVRRAGQFYPDILNKIMRMKQINNERIRLARQIGDSDLVRYYESQKMSSEAIIRRWGFD